MNTVFQSWVEKYRPTQLSNLILPSAHGLAPALSYVESPFPSAWLLFGRPGLGKTSLANIMASSAAGHELNIQEYVGPDLDSLKVKQLATETSHRPLFGKMHVVIVNEADSIPQGGQVRLLSILDRLQFSSWIFTSNEATNEFESRFLSRVRSQLFTSQGIYSPATDWLLSIAEKEQIPLERSAAQRLVKDAKNNLRDALQNLELMGSELRRAMRKPTVNLARTNVEESVPGLPFIPVEARVPQLQRASI